MSERVTPCVYPNCRDIDGNPRLTFDLICPRCRRQYRRVLDWLLLDFVWLKANLPAPFHDSDSRPYQSPKAKSFGHPAEWASMACTEIASALNWAEDGLRDHLKHSPGIRPNARESIVVAHGHKYLTAQFEALCTYPAAADTAVELADLHGKIRSQRGLTRRLQLLPTPCPVCDVAALVRDVGQIGCENCGKIIDEMHYDWFAGYVVDQILDAYDAQKASS